VRIFFLFSDALIFDVYIAGVEGNRTESKIRNFTFKHYFNKILTLEILHTLMFTFMNGICLKVTFL